MLLSKIKKLIIILPLLLCSFSLKAQNVSTIDSLAISILKKMADSYSKYNCVEIKWDYTLSLDEDVVTQKGKIIAFGKNYRLERDGNIIVYDGGDYIYSYKTYRKEIDTLPKKEQHAFDIFKLQYEDYTYSILQEHQSIEIIAKSKSFREEVEETHLKINKSNYELISLKNIQRNEIETTLKIFSTQEITPKDKYFKIEKP